MTFIYLHSCNNAHDGYEKVFFIQLILITNDKHQNLYANEAKIRTRQGFKSGNQGDQGNGTVIL